MNTTKIIGTLALVALLGTGLLAAPAIADTPSIPRNIKTMDANKDGRIDREEYLTFLSERFDEAADSKGYCTFEEVRQGFDWMDLDLP